MTSQKVIGAIYPLTASQVKRFFYEEKTGFVKFTNMTNFKANSKIIFYVKGEKVLFGEGTIKSVSKMSPSEAWSKYSKDIFLNQQEYESYTQWSPIEKKPRTNAEITVFFLKNLKRFKTPHQFSGITPSGRYISEEEYNKVISEMEVQK